MIGRTLRGLLFVLASLTTLLLIAAVIVRFTVRDSMNESIMLYFATPWPVIAGAALVCAIYWVRNGARFLAALLTVLSLVSVVLWLQSDWQWRTAPTARGDLRVVHWNVDRPDWRQVWTFAWLAEQNADIIAIAEREPKKRDMTARWETAFPGYKKVPQPGELLLLVRGEVLSAENQMLGERSYVSTVRVRVRGHEVTVLQADINGTPWISRAKPLGQLMDIIHRHDKEHIILLGDFNTPLDSVDITPLRKELKNAFELVGSGCSATWPAPVPVLTIDQIWSTPGLRPERCQNITLWQSDHRAVVAEFSFTH
jgi:vancomycin resistance protein VanJ